MNIDLGTRRALVCGSSQGIGRAVAAEMAGLGAEVGLLARDWEGLERVRRMLVAARGQVHRVLVADFRRPEAVRSVVTGFLAESGPVHILVNNTGGPRPGPPRRPIRAPISRRSPSTSSATRSWSRRSFPG